MIQIYILIDYYLLLLVSIVYYNEYYYYIIEKYKNFNFKNI